MINYLIDFYRDLRLLFGTLVYLWIYCKTYRKIFRKKSKEVIKKYMRRWWDDGATMKSFIYQLNMLHYEKEMLENSLIEEIQEDKVIAEKIDVIRKMAGLLREDKTPLSHDEKKILYKDNCKVFTIGILAFLTIVLSFYSFL